MILNYCLEILMALPLLAGGYILALCRKRNDKDIFSIATLLSSIILIFSIHTFSLFLDHKIVGHKIGPFMFDVDGLSMLMILLTTLLMPICIMAAKHSVSKRVPEFVTHFFILECAIIGSFLARDLISFYIFFELTLVPMFFIIGIWGGKNRTYAAFKLFLYTFFASIFMLIAIIFIIVNIESPTLNSVITTAVSHNTELVLFLCFFGAFAVKLPMFPLHTWLPNAHVEAPTSGSVILAGVLIKLGGYGMIRLTHMMPFATEFFSNSILILSIIAIVYASIIAIMQSDIKKMIAYSSIAHMGYVTVGIFSLSQVGINAAVFQMLSHGIISSALFLCVGVIYDRLHTREFINFGGIANKMPTFAFLLMIFTMGSVGLPGTSGFVGEFLAILSVFKVSKLFAALVASGVIFGAAYMLYMYKKTMFGEITNSEVTKIKPIHRSEIIYLGILATLTVTLGIYPSAVFGVLNS